MYPIEQILIPDPQQQPFRLCPQCHREVYAPGYFCIRCGREMP